MMRNDLALLCSGTPHHVGRDVGLYQVGRPEVPQPTQKVEGPISHGDKGIFAEQDGFASVGWLRELGKHYARHAGLKKHSSCAYFVFSCESNYTITKVCSSVCPSILKQNPQTARNQSIHLTTIVITILTTIFYILTAIYKIFIFCCHF